MIPAKNPTPAAAPMAHYGLPWRQRSTCLPASFDWSTAGMIKIGCLRLRDTLCPGVYDIAQRIVIGPAGMGGRHDLSPNNGAMRVNKQPCPDLKTCHKNFATPLRHARVPNYEKRNNFAKTLLLLG